MFSGNSSLREKKKRKRRRKKRRKEETIRETNKNQSYHLFRSTALFADGIFTTGPLVMPSAVTNTEAPPPSLMALQPRCVEATRQPSVVAMGMGTMVPFTSTGPARPTGMGM